MPLKAVTQMPNFQWYSVREDAPRIVRAILDIAARIPGVCIVPQIAYETPEPFVFREYDSRLEQYLDTSQILLILDERHLANLSIKQGTYQASSETYYWIDTNESVQVIMLHLPQVYEEAGYRFLNPSQLELWARCWDSVSGADVRVTPATQKLFRSAVSQVKTIAKPGINRRPMASGALRAIRDDNVLFSWRGIWHNGGGAAVGRTHGKDGIVPMSMME